VVEAVLELPFRVTTFARVFGRLNPQQFQQCFLDWIKASNKITEGEVIAIDGKALRLMIKEQIKKAIHGECLGYRKSAMLGQVKVNKNQMKLRQFELLKAPGLSGCIVTIDAMVEDCQVNNRA